MLNRARFSSALNLAVELHADQSRKGSGIPYMTHLMAVCALVGEHDGDEDLMIAALLHDSLEDRPDRIALPAIVARFGWRVGSVVRGCTDCHSFPKPPWEQRKQAFVERLRGESSDVKLVVAADKLHNANCWVLDLDRFGEDHWRCFNASKERICWYMLACLDALRSGFENRILDRLEVAVRALEICCNAGESIVHNPGSCG